MIQHTLASALADRGKLHRLGRRFQGGRRRPTATVLTVHDKEQDAGAMGDQRGQSCRHAAAVRSADQGRGAARRGGRSAAAGDRADAAAPVAARLGRDADQARQCAGPISPATTASAETADAAVAAYEPPRRSTTPERDLDGWERPAALHRAGRLLRASAFQTMDLPRLKLRAIPRRDARRANDAARRTALDGCAVLRPVHADCSNQFARGMLSK